MFLSVGTVVCGKRTLLPSRHHSGPLRFPPSQLASRQPQPPLDLLGHFLTAAGEAAYSRYTCAAGGAVETQYDIKRHIRGRNHACTPVITKRTLSAQSMLCNLLCETAMKARLSPGRSAMLKRNRTTATRTKRRLTVRP